MLRCADCGIPIYKKSPKGRWPKYCKECREIRQRPYRKEK